MKYRIKLSLFFLFTAAFFLYPYAEVYAKEEHLYARQVKLSATSSSDQFRSKKMLDNDELTYSFVYKPTEITVSSDQEFKSVYIKFEKNIKWSITLPDGKKIEPSEEDFIHKYLTFDNAVSSFMLSLPGYSAVTDIYAFTEGEPPDWVQIWQPPCERADLMMMPTHADDEFLWFGGTLPYYAGELGYEVQVVYLTNHNNKTYRNHERLNSLWTVGVRHYPVISSFTDVKETKAGVNEAARIFGYKKVMAFQVEVLRRFKPRVVIAHDYYGEYGHGAHKLNARTLLEALPLTDDASQYPASAKKYGTCKIQKCYLHLWKENQVEVSWSDKKLSRFEGMSALDVAAEGLKCDVSQKLGVKMKESGRYDCRKFGLAYTNVGLDTPGKNDFFENVDWSDKKTRQTDGSSDVGQEDETEVSASDDFREEERISPSDNSSAGVGSISSWVLLNTAVIVVLMIASFARLVVIRHRK